MTRARRPRRSNPRASSPQRDSTPKALAARPARAPVPQAKPPGTRAADKAYVVRPDDLGTKVGEVNPFKASFFHSIAKVNVRTAHGGVSIVNDRQRTLADARGYTRDDLFAVAEIGYHYLFSGGLKLALTLFEGLVAVEPDEAYFALALGLTHDHLGNRAEANTWYHRASVLDPTDGRADINRAELFLQGGDKSTARKLLSLGAQKARALGDQALARKATALIHHIASAT